MKSKIIIGIIAAVAVAGGAFTVSQVKFIGKQSFTWHVHSVPHPPGEAGNPVHVANPRTEDRNPCSPTQVQENTVDRCRKPRNPTTGDPDVRRTSEA